MRYLPRSSVLRLRGSPFPRPRSPLGTLRPSRRGSSPERDMTMDHDIGTLELREQPDSHEDREREGQARSSTTSFASSPSPILAEMTLLRIQPTKTASTEIVRELRGAV